MFHRVHLALLCITKALERRPYSYLLCPIVLSCFRAIGMRFTSPTTRLRRSGSSERKPSHAVSDTLEALHLSTRPASASLGRCVLFMNKSISNVNLLFSDEFIAGLLLLVMVTVLFYCCRCSLTSCCCRMCWLALTEPWLWSKTCLETLRAGRLVESFSFTLS